MATTRTATRAVTDADRFVAHQRQRHFEEALPGAEWFARLIEDCREAEAFPKTHTPEAVEVAQQVLTLMGDSGPWDRPMTRADHLQRSGQWCACDRARA